ncbi:MAG: Ger(x)C family spore germination protein [Bacillota bacterium]
MKKAGKILCLPLIIAFMASMSGCWNYRDIEDIAVAVGMAVDKTDDGAYLLTTEIAHPSDKELKSYRIQAKGKTIFDCMRNTGEKLENKAYWSNAQVMILSQEVAKEGLLPVLDIAERNRELRPTLQLIVSREKTARELLETQGIATSILSAELASILKNSEQNISRARVPALYKVVDDICSEGKTVSLPAVKKVQDGNKEVNELDGTAVFSQQGLVGFLSDEESKALLFIQNEIRGGLLTVRDTGSAAKNPYITLEIRNNETIMKPERINGSLVMHITMKSDVVMGENDTGRAYDGEYGSGYLQRQAQAMLEESVRSLVRRVQQEYNADIFGFGSVVRSDMPALWKEIGPDWYNGGFRNLTVNVTSQIRIIDNGLLKEPVGDGA